MDNYIIRIVGLHTAYVNLGDMLTGNYRVSRVNASVFPDIDTANLFCFLLKHYYHQYRFVPFKLKRPVLKHNRTSDESITLPDTDYCYTFRSIGLRAYYFDNSDAFHYATDFYIRISYHSDDNNYITMFDVYIPYSYNSLSRKMKFELFCKKLAFFEHALPMSSQKSLFADYDIHVTM